MYEFKYHNDKTIVFSVPIENLDIVQVTLFVMFSFINKLYFNNDFNSLSLNITVKLLVKQSFITKSDE